MSTKTIVKQSAWSTLTLALLGWAGPAGATVMQDFDNPGTAFVGQKLPSPAFQRFTQDSGPAPTVTAGRPFGNFLRLKDNEFRSYTTAGFERDGPGDFGRIAGSFDFRVTCRGTRLNFTRGGCADGFNVSFLDTSLYGNSGQVETTADGTIALNEGSEAFDYSDDAFGPTGIDAIRSGFTMGFAFFNRSSGAVIIGDGSVRDATVDSQVDLATGVEGVFDNTADGFITAVFDLDLTADLFSLSLTRAGVTVNLFSGYDMSGLNLDPFNARLDLGARSGDAAATIDIDNINIRFVEAVGDVGDVPEPALAGLFGLGLAGLAVTRRRRR